MLNKKIFSFVFLLLSAGYSNLSAQNFFSWDEPGCYPIARNGVELEGAMFIVIRNYCPDDELFTMSIQLKKLQNNVEVQALELDGFEPVGSHEIDGQIRLVLKSDVGFEVKDFNSNLEEVNGFVLPFSSQTHFVHLVEHPDGLFAVTVRNGSAVFTLMSNDGMFLEEIEMEGPCLTYPPTKCFSKLIDDSTVLVSLHCDRTSYVSLNALASSTWLEGIGNGCGGLSETIFDEASNTFTAFSSDGTGVIVVDHNQYGDVIDSFVLTDTTDLYMVDANISQESNICMLGALSTIVPLESTLDLTFLLINSVGDVLYQFILFTETHSELNMEMTETEDAFWFCGAQESYETLAVNAFVYRLSKDLVFTGVEETIGEVSNFSLLQAPSELIVQHVNQSPFTAFIYSISGQLIAQASGKELSLYTGDYPRGVYILVCDDGATNTSFKFVR